jgi:hypothetical protein
VRRRDGGMFFISCASLIIYNLQLSSLRFLFTSIYHSSIITTPHTLLKGGAMTELKMPEKTGEELVSLVPYAEIPMLRENWVPFLPPMPLLPLLPLLLSTWHLLFPLDSRRVPLISLLRPNPPGGPSPTAPSCWTCARHSPPCSPSSLVCSSSSPLCSALYPLLSALSRDPTHAHPPQRSRPRVNT